MLLNRPILSSGSCLTTFPLAKCHVKALLVLTTWATLFGSIEALAVHVVSRAATFPGVVEAGTRLLRAAKVGLIHDLGHVDITSESARCLLDVRVDVCGLK